MSNYLFSFSHFFAAIIYATLGGIIITKDFRSRLNQSCTAIFACFAIWSLFFTGLHHPAASLSTARLCENFASLGWIWFSFFHLWFAGEYTRQRPMRFRFLIISLLVAVPVLLSYQQFAHSVLVDDHHHTSFGWLSQWRKSPWTVVYFAYYLLVSSFGLYLINKHRVTTDNPIIKKQSTVLVISALLTMLFGSLVNVIFPLMGCRLIVPIADVTTLIWAAGLAYVATKYRMLDITPFVAAQRIITVMKDLLFLLDIRGNIISVNPSALRSLECTNEQLIGRPFTQLIDESGEVRNNLADTVLTADAYACETTLALSGGPSLPVILSTSLIPGTGIVCVAHDNSLQQQRTRSLNEAKKQLETEVSRATDRLQETNRRLIEEIAERKQAAHSLMETEERFRIIFEHAPDGIFLSDTEGTIIDGNNEVARITGFEKSVFVGKNIFTATIIPAVHHAIISAMFDANRKGKPSPTHEISLVRNDGRTIPLEVTSHLVNIGTRNLVLGVIRDLTQKKIAEAEAEELKQQLHHAQKMDAIGRLAGGIAHDFNNLLGGIIGYSSLLRNKLVATLPEQAATLDKILDVAHQASHRTAQLLAFARKGKYQVATVDINNLINDVVGLLEHTIDKKITLERHFATPTALVSGDRSQLHSMLLNLGVNARDALPGGGVISFTTDILDIDETASENYRFSVTPGTFIKITITDNGIGMDAATRDRAFEPFFSTKEPGKGTGLGLASTYGTVKSHNGFIELWSESGKGTIFTICLPQALPETNGKQQETRPAEAPATSGSGTIVIVDDIDIVREMVDDALTDAGYTVHSFSEGNDVLEWFKEHHGSCELVILDLTMPGISGVECFNAMKEISPSIKTIISSGHTIDHEINTLLVRGAQAFLQKPFEIDQLIATVHRVLSEPGHFG